MTESERVEVLRNFLDSIVLGVPILWWVSAIFLSSIAAMAWISVSSRREHD